MGKFVVTWTDEEDAFLKRHASLGYTYGAIGRMMGRSRNSVIGRASRMKMPPRPQPPPKPVAPRIPRPKKTDGGKLANKLRAGTFGQAPKIPPAKPEPPSPYAGPPVGILDANLKHHHCRAIVSGRGPQTMFCGGPVPEDSHFAYCAHHALAFVPRVTPRAAKQAFEQAASRQTAAAAVLEAAE